MNFRQYKKIPCPMCEGRGRVHGWDCKRCNTEGEVSVPVEDIERSAAWKAAQEAKADAGKPRPTLVPVSLIEAVASIREYGVAKYHDPDNWKKVDAERYRNAAFRHWLAYIKGEKLDPESGLPHLHHCACNLAFLIEMETGVD